MAKRYLKTQPERTHNAVAERYQAAGASQAPFSPPNATTQAYRKAKDKQVAFGLNSKAKALSDEEHLTRHGYRKVE